MPNLFGMDKSNIPHQIVTKIVKQLDTKSMVETAPLVNKDWYKILNGSEMKELRESAKDRLRVFDLVSRVTRFERETPDTIGVSRLGGGLTNQTYRFAAQNSMFVARRPGKKSDAFIDRKSESINLKIASQCGISAEVVYDAKQGDQITKFLLNPTTMTCELLKDPKNIEKIVHPLKIIHESKERFANDINIFNRSKKMLALLAEKKVELSSDYKTISLEIDKIEALFDSLKIVTVPCHNDTTPSNFIESNGAIKLIDWEYSGNNDPIWDLANLSMEAEFNKDQDLKLFHSYFGETWDDSLFQRFLVYKPVVEFWAGLWAQVQIANQNQLDKLDDLYKIESRIQNCYRLLNSEAFKNAFSSLNCEVNRQCRI